jgi:ligand-binding sensor domain-containing protein
MKKLLFLFLPFYLQAQDTPIGSWKNYLSYSSSSYIAEADDKIYCVANGGLFFIKKSDETINRLSKVTDLSDVGVKQVAHSYELNITIITYENCNIDLLKNNQIVNISDIKRKDFSGLKTINNITLKDNIAYLSSSLGLVLVDLINNEIKDVYNIGGQNENIVTGCALLGDSIIAATSNGLYIAKTTGSNLTDYNNWTLYHDSYNSYDNIIASNNAFFIDTSSYIISISINNNNLIQAFSDSVQINNSKAITSSRFENIKYALIDDENNIWVADSSNGLLKFVNYEYAESYIPESPRENRLFSVEFMNNKLYICHGGHVNFGTFWNKNGASVMDNFDNWRNYDYYELKNARDILEVAKYGNKTYFASYYNGIIELENGEVNERYSWWNTDGGLDTIANWQNDNKMAISDLKFDNDGNMWGLLSGVDNPLFVKTINNEWYKFSISSTQTFLFDEMLIDNHNQKWGIIGRNNGIFVYNDNNTITNLDDDEYTFINMSIGKGNLPSMDIYCLANDLDGEIWVGSDKGISVFYDPEAVFSGYNFDAQQILITEGNYGQYLLSEEKVKCITIDGANRKWIGTEKSGVFLLSDDGQEEILHFTKNNSPLFSDNIVDIAINHENGEVFIGTEKGLISYRSDATKGVVSQSKTRIFPNPVNENYNGPIAISGLVTDANIKITDVSGSIVFETIANGGEAIWNGKNKNGDRSSTGVYLVFSTDLYGKEKIVSKILFIH